jgi:hypothetical protein
MKKSGNKIQRVCLKADPIDCSSGQIITAPKTRKKAEKPFEVKRYISWDVGIRNLSYCKLLVAGPSPGEVIIEAWDCIDIINDETDIPSTLQSNIQSNIQSIGSSSAKKAGKIKKKTCSNVSIPESAELLITALQKRPFLLDPRPSVILIETQPGGSFANIRMKTMSHVLQTWFFIMIPEVSAEFVSAKKKLQVTAESVFGNVDQAEDQAEDHLKKVSVGEKRKREEGETEEVSADKVTRDPSKADKKKYALNKKYSVTTCAQLLGIFKNGSEASQIFIKHKKKDDLADCLLQALAIIFPVKKIVKKRLVTKK